MKLVDPPRSQDRIRTEASIDAAVPATGLFAHADGVQVAALKNLQGVDWDFPNRVAHAPIEGIHPYPAKFVAEIPGNLLDCLPLQQGTAVLDPFCGSGTTLVECQARGIPSVGIDLNPIACLMSRVKTAPLKAGVEAEAQRVLAVAQGIKAPKIPRLPNIDHWFERPVQDALASLTVAISKAPTSHRDFLRLALSSIIVRVSNQESDTRYAAIDKSVSKENVFSWFEQAVRKLASALEQRDYHLAPAQIIEGDTLLVKPGQISKKIGLVITSPPYPNAYEYWLYHKYRMWWLGFDPISVKAAEIGARAHFFKTNHHKPEDFGIQMAQTFNLIDKVTVAGAYACFVVGRSKIHGKIVDNAATIESVAKRYGFHLTFKADRSISANRKSFNLSHANIKKETLIVMQKS